jgi:plasmid stabilization system protein ParE
MNVRYSRHALRQIAEIIETISGDAPGAANAFARRVETLSSLLARHPAIGRPTDLAGVRVFAARPYPYLIFYREESDGITVLRVRHMARQEDWRRGR